MKQHHHLSVFFILMLTTVTFTGCFESLQVPEQDSRNEGNYSWTFDFETHVLTITGSGAFNCDLKHAYYNAYYHDDYQYYSYYREIIEKVIIEDGITSIGENVFWECKSLNSVTIPNSVTSIGKKAFYNCISLTSIIIGDKVTDIGDEAFSGCSSLPSIEIPNSVASINEKAFFGCSSLKSVIWNAENCADFKSAPFVDCPITSFTLSDEVEHIPAYLCRNMDKLKSIKLPNSVTSIGDYAFDGCNGLNSPIYSKRIFAYMPTSYYGAYSILDGIECIIGRAFYNCNNLTSLEIPSSVTSIEDDAFYGCRNLNTVTLNSDAIVNRNYSTSKHITGIFGSQVRKYIIGDRVTGIGTYAFYQCDYLNSIEIGNNVTSIGAHAFYDCNLASVEVPNSVTNIGYGAFENCGNLKSATLGNSVRIIEDMAFNDCDRLTFVICKAGTPPTIERYVFSSVYNNAIHIIAGQIDLYVPAASVELYKKAENWRYFKSISAIVE